MIPACNPALRMGLVLSLAVTRKACRQWYRRLRAQQRTAYQKAADVNAVSVTARTSVHTASRDDSSPPPPREPATDEQGMREMQAFFSGVRYASTPNDKGLARRLGLQDLVSRAWKLHRTL